MANTLTPFLGNLIRALDTVSRGRYGFVRGASRGTGVERAALNDDVKVPLIPDLTPVDNTATMDPTDQGDFTVTSTPITLTKDRAVPIPFSGDDMVAIGNSGQADEVQMQLMESAFNALLDEMDTDLYGVARVAASRAYGTAGTTPFASSLADLAQVEKILTDNGSPPANRILVLNTSASANMKSLAQLSAVNQAGSDLTLRTGMLPPVYSFQPDESTQIGLVTKGTGTGFLVNNGAGYAIGDTSITLDTGSGTILAGDVVTFAGDTNKYVVKTALAANVIVLQEPGLRQTLADDVALTVGGDYTPSLAFHRGALALAVRPPALPRLPDGSLRDYAEAHELVTDPNTGITFDVGFYLGRKKLEMRIAAVWGYAAIKGKHMATLLG